MTAHSKGLPQDLAAAIEDLRHIRRALETARSNHPLRVVARPLLGYSIVLGLFVVGFGALVIAVSTSVALPEWSFFGGLLFLLGAVSMFALSQWPFYTLALCWGGSLVAGGLVLRRRFPRTLRPDATAGRRW